MPDHHRSHIVHLRSVHVKADEPVIMSTAKINIRNMDYFKYRRLVIDGNRDDYAGCSREVKSLCDAVQTLSFRDDEFDDRSDRSRFDDISACYRQILASKRIDPVDMRLKSGWWGEPGRTGAGYSAGKICRRNNAS